MADQSSDVSLPIDSASAIYFDVLSGATVIVGNLIDGADAQNVPRVIYSNFPLHMTVPSERCWK